MIYPWHFEIDYACSYGENTPFFTALAKHKLLGAKCKKCKLRYATPRLSCLECGSQCSWFELPKSGRIHSWTKCYFGGRAPFFLILVEFDQVDTFFMSRLKGVRDEKSVFIGMPVRARFSAEKPKHQITDVWFEQER